MKTTVLGNITALHIQTQTDLGMRFGATTFRLWPPPLDIAFLAIVGSALGCAGIMTVELITLLASKSEMVSGLEISRSIFQRGFNQYFCGLIFLGVSAFSVMLAAADSQKLEAFGGRTVTRLRHELRGFYGLGVRRTAWALTRALPAVLASWLAIAALVIAIWLAEFELAKETPAQMAALTSGLPLFFICLGLTANAHRVVTKVMADAARAAGRKPIVFLRSFSDDSFRPALAPDPMGVLMSAADRKRAAQSSRRLEECIAPHITDFGPFVAVGEPNVPRDGATRVFLSDDQWQGQVIAWVHEALAIVMVAGTTEGLRWELNAILQAGALDRAILLWPDDKKSERLAVIQQHVRGTPWELGMQSVDADKIKAITFKSDGGLFLVYADQRKWGARVFEYAFNFALCAALLLPTQVGRRPRSA